MMGVKLWLSVSNVGSPYRLRDYWVAPVGIAGVLLSRKINLL